MGSPCLAARCPPSCFTLNRTEGEQGEKLVVLGKNREITYHRRQNSPDSEKINLLLIKVDLDSEKQKVKYFPPCPSFSKTQPHSFIPNFSKASTNSGGLEMGNGGRGQFVTICTRCFSPLHTVPPPHCEPSPRAAVPQESTPPPVRCGRQLFRINLLQHRLSTGCTFPQDITTCSGVAAVWTSALMLPTMGCRDTTSSTTAFSTGCSGTSARAWSISSLSFFSDLGVRKAVFRAFFPHSLLLRSIFCHFLSEFCRGAVSLGGGISRVLSAGPLWSQLELAQSNVRAAPGLSSQGSLLQPPTTNAWA